MTTLGVGRINGRCGANDGCSRVRWQFAPMMLQLRSALVILRALQQNGVVAGPAGGILTAWLASDFSMNHRRIDGSL
jgi:hypothetical protein